MLIIVIRDSAQGVLLTCGSPSVEDELMVENRFLYSFIYLSVHSSNIH